MVLYLLAVGRVRHAALREACDDYLTRARRYLRIELREVPDSARGGRERPQALEREAAALLKALPPGVEGVALSRGGRDEDSTMFAARVADWQQRGRDVALIIGGAYGLDQSVLRRCRLTVRLSSYTLPHELARLVLLEQLYRAGTIIRGEPYHKGAR
jgi:23S rRNA (pseudouridine1915-N3)-methyltransferase